MDRLNDSQLKGIRKILVIQLGPFGDVLLTTSYFEALRRRLPAAQLWFLVKEPYDLAIRDHPLIDRIMVISRRTGLGYALERLRTVFRIRRERFDLVIDQQLKPSSQQLTFLSGARYRLGYKEGRLSGAYNLKASFGPPRYSASGKFDILKPLGIEEEPYKIFFHVPARAAEYIDDWLREAGLDGTDLVCVSPGSPVARKKWNGAGFARLADLIQSGTACRVLLLWGPAELETAHHVESLMETDPVFAPRTDLHQAAALLRRCRLLVCNDGGLNHIAVTTGTATLAIFGPTDPAIWSPASVFSHHHHLHRPDFDSEADDSFGVTPEAAFEKAVEILSDRTGMAMTGEAMTGGGP